MLSVTAPWQPDPLPSRALVSLPYQPVLLDQGRLRWREERRLGEQSKSFRSTCVARDERQTYVTTPEATMKICPTGSSHGFPEGSPAALPQSARKGYRGVWGAPPQTAAEPPQPYFLRGSEDRRNRRTITAAEPPHRFYFREL